MRLLEAGAGIRTDVLPERRDSRQGQEARGSQRVTITHIIKTPTASNRGSIRLCSTASAFCAQVSFEDVDRLKCLGQTEHVRIPHFLQDQVSYAEQLEKIMEVNQLTDEELRTLL